MISSVDHLVICWTSVCLLWEMSIQVFRPFFNWVIFFFSIELSGFFVCFGYLLLIRYILCKYLLPFICCSVTKSCPTLLPHGLQHSSIPCPSLSPGDCSDSCPLSWRCHPTISSSVAPFSSCPQSFPASGSFPMSQLFTSGGQSMGASAPVLPFSRVNFHLVSFAVQRFSV